MAITDYHQLIFNYLETYRREYPEADLTYLLRQKSKEGRPRHTYLFAGSEKYISIGLYMPVSNNSKTRTINFNAAYDPVSNTITGCRLYIAYSDSNLDAQQAIHQQIIQRIGLDQFQEIGDKRYKLRYNGPDWQINLRTYLDQHKPIIDEILQEAGVYETFHCPPKDLERDIEAVSQPQIARPAGINYWVFQGNPAYFKIAEALKDNALRTWQVAAHAEWIKPGDRVILWVTGAESGCYALAEVTSEIYTGTNEPVEYNYQIGLISGTPTRRVKLKILLNLWNNPVYKNDLINLSAFNGFKGGNQGTNFTATQEQYGAIEHKLSKDQSVETLPDLYSKNIILYGPPGTGKTYETIDLAVDIIDARKDPSRKINKARFDQLRKDGQIEFVTFHQNYTYEDFVMGLKPDVDGEDLKFQRSYGIFYKLAKQARDNYEDSRVDTRANFLKSFDKVIEEYLQPLVYLDNPIDVPMPSGKIFQLIKVTDNSIKFDKSNGNQDHSISIATLEKLYNGTIDFPIGGMKTYYKPLVEQLREKGTTREMSFIPLKRYVLIIDEINRANMSRVFGELITLLEDDKRLGGDNELTVTLPSGELFSVPPNLYLIGTMNTADKSLALLDIALRRRFEFIGKYPNYTVLEEPAKSLLERLNKVILLHKKSADFLIGHAYFMNKSAQQLKSVLDNRVIPLLLEYFNGRTDLVETVLKEAQVLVSKHELTFQLEATDEWTR